MPNILTGSTPDGVPPPLPQEAAGAPAQAQGAPAAPAQQQPPPQLSHQQAAAALRHFSAISRQLEVLMNKPELGKSDIKPDIIDGTTKLVASRIISPGQAVQQLTSVPADPLMQRKWVQQHFEQTMVAMNGVLDHYAAGQPNPQEAAAHLEKSSADDHLSHMSAVHSQYQGRKNGGH